MPRPNTSQLAYVILIGLVAVALWQEFAPENDPGSDILAQADAVVLTDKSAQGSLQACRLYRDALIEGNRIAAFRLSRCIETGRYGSESDRRALQYAILTLALDASENGRSGLQRRDALNATDEEMRAARSIDVISVLKGQIIGAF